MNILVVEPDRTLAGQYSEALSAGNTVEWCQNAQAAILATDAAKPDIILLELALPGHSGIEFLYELRSYAEWQRIPVIVLSRLQAWDSGLQPDTRETLGIKKYLYKPDVSLKDLVRIVERSVALSGKGT